MKGIAEAAARLDERCSRAEYEFPLLAAPDGTVAVPIGDLRLLLTASADTRPLGGDAKQAPFTSGAVPSEARADAQKDTPHD